MKLCGRGCSRRYSAQLSVPHRPYFCVIAGLLHRCICTAQPRRHHKTTTRAAYADRNCDRTLRNIHHHYFQRRQRRLPFPATQQLHHPAPLLHHSAAANNPLRGYLAICEQPHYQGTRHSRTKQRCPLFDQLALIRARSLCQRFHFGARTWLQNNLRSCGDYQHRRQTPAANSCNSNQFRTN